MCRKINLADMYKVDVLSLTYINLTDIRFTDIISLLTRNEYSSTGHLVVSLQTN